MKHEKLTKLILLTEEEKKNINRTEQRTEWRKNYEYVSALNSRWRQIPICVYDKQK